MSMKFFSTKDKHKRNPVTLSNALLNGLAEDGGLYVPEDFTPFNWQTLDEDIAYNDFAICLLRPFFEEDNLASSLADIVKQSFQFSAPIQSINSHTSVLELFHGLTLSFKDFGAQFLASCLSHIKQDKAITILVATSGDTGSAVAGAFYGKDNTQVVILFPKGKVSLRQQQQMTCWHGNVSAIEVDGSFDDCQKLVKSAFVDSWWQENVSLNTSNSINIGRLLPQMTYYAYSAWQFYLKHGKKANFIVPSGNMGNVCACFWAKAMGLPIDQVIIAQNENDTVSQYLQLGHLPQRKSIETLANAMDVAVPSNFERLLHLYSELDVFKQQVTAFKVSDDEIKQTIKKVYQQYQYLICPHTATAFKVKEKLGDDNHHILVSTAHPIKFEQVVEPLVGVEIAVPERLQNLLDSEHEMDVLSPDLERLTALYKARFLNKSS